MKRVLCILSVLIFSILLVGSVQAKTLRLAMDADPYSLDPHVQLSGGMLQYSHLGVHSLLATATLTKR